MVKIKINGKQIEVEEGLTILKAAKKLGIKIPSLCYHPDIQPTSACGICVVKLANQGNKYVRSCSMIVEEGMDIITHDAEINTVRKGVLELVLSAHPNDCLNCIRNGECELQTAAADFGVRNSKYDNIKQNHPRDESAGSIVLNPEKCIKCGRCVVVCQEMQRVHALGFVNRGFDTYFAPSAVSLKDSPCVDCGQCAAHCPVAAIYEKDQTKEVEAAIDDPNTYVTVQMAPSVRVALGEYFGLKPGDNITGKIYAAMRLMGFDAIFDTNFGADMTIMEEAHEFVKRFTESNGTYAMTTSCCPAWVKYVEEYYPDLLDNVSSAKSPHMMLAPMTKTYYSEKANVDPFTIFNVSIMPCTAKKNEIRKNETMYSSGYKDVDVVLTTREFARMIKHYGIDVAGIEPEEADSILGEYSGAGTIFGATGGVMEAALRTAYNIISGTNLDNVDFEEVRGLEGVKRAAVKVLDKDVKIAVVNGLHNVDAVMQEMREAKQKGENPPYNFIEVMACQGGCVGGGGQPYGTTNQTRTDRAKGLYDEDKKVVKHRCSHENENLKKLYDDFLGKPLGERAHHFLHTEYKADEKYTK
ncbi:NADH-dependent [FeFe] hydrogenase, group A6 [Brachyspira murdochii]|uniref:NADH-dependent [FeFe] hydrogenase, group A6 n=1 Tax=Brachyspira murdochii TaxID=84378 RepID=UPI003003E024